MMKKWISLALCVVFALSFFIPASALSISDVLGMVYWSSDGDIKGASHCFSFNFTETCYILSVVPVSANEDYSYSCLFHDLTGKAKVNYDGTYFTVLTMRKKGLQGFEIKEETVTRGDTVHVYYYNVDHYENASSLNADNLIKETVTITSADNGLYEISQELDAAAEGGLVVDEEGTCVGIVASSESMKHVIGFSYVINEILKNDSTVNDSPGGSAGLSEEDSSAPKGGGIGKNAMNIFWILFGVILLAFLVLLVFFIIKRNGKKAGGDSGGSQHPPTPIPNSFGDQSQPAPVLNKFAGDPKMPVPAFNNFGSSPTMSTPTLDNFGGHLNIPAPVLNNFGGSPHQSAAADNMDVSQNRPKPVSGQIGGGQDIPAPFPEDPGSAPNIQTPAADDPGREPDLPKPAADDPGGAPELPTPAADDFGNSQDLHTQDPDHFEEIQDTPGDRICLCGKRGYFDGRIFELTGTVTIGRRSSHCNIHYPVDQKGISGIHCQLRRVGQQLEITDLGSSYGTFVNGVALIPNVPATLSVGDTFWLANRENGFIVYE